jgi:hypothetical protein
MIYTTQRMGADYTGIFTELIDTAGNLGTAAIQGSTERNVAKSAEKIAAIQAQGQGGNSQEGFMGLSTTTMLLIGGGALVLILGAGLLMRK